MKIQIVFIVIILLFTFIATLKNILDNRQNIYFRLMCIIIFAITFWVSFQRDTYLPFLGYSALPSTVIKDVFTPENSNIETNIDVNAPDGTKIIYWGAIPSDKNIMTPLNAYHNYENAGISYVHQGKALLRFNCPSKYNIPWGKTLDRHLHYRLVSSIGMLSPIETVYINC